MLGELLAADGDLVVTLRAAKHRELLAALLLTPNRPVATGDLMDILWDKASPPSAIEALRTYVMRIRRILGPRLAARLATAAPGYLLEVGEGEYDVEQFQRASAAGRAAMHRRDWGAADEAFAAGLALWRGAPYADVPADHFAREIGPGLEAARLRVAEWRAETEMALGHDAEAAARLREITTRDRLRERTHELLIRALARAGEPAAAPAA